MAAQSYPPESDPVATALVEALDARVEALEEESSSAEDVSLTPFGTITATNVQAGMEEIFDEAADGGSAIVPVVAGNLTATYTLDQDDEVEVALEGTLNVNCAFTWDGWPAGYSRATLSLTKTGGVARTLSINGSADVLSGLAVAATAVEIDLKTFDGGSTVHVAVPAAAGATGATGATGSTGATGAAGNTILATSGAPSGGTGVNGDYAYDAATTTMYGPKAGGTWPAGVILSAGDELVVVPRSTQYLLTPGTVAGAAFQASGRCHYTPIVVPRTLTFDRIAIHLTAEATTGTVRLGIHAPNAAGDGPGALIHDAGTVSIAAGSGGAAPREITIDQTLARGVYFLTCQPEYTGTPAAAQLSSAPSYLFSVRTSVTGNSLIGYYQANTGALPSPATVTPTANSSSPVVFLRRA